MFQCCEGRLVNTAVQESIRGCQIALTPLRDGHARSKGLLPAARDLGIRENEKHSANKSMW